MDIFSTEGLTSFFISLFGGLFLICFLVLLIIGCGYALLLWYRNREREAYSLNSTLLQVALPRDNEIKIDAAEQLFASLASLRKGGRLSFLKMQPQLSFEIVGIPSDRSEE